MRASVKLRRGTWVDFLKLVRHVKNITLMSDIIHYFFNPSVYHGGLNWEQQLNNYVSADTTQYPHETITFNVSHKDILTFARFLSRSRNLLQKISGLYPQIRRLKYLYVVDERTNLYDAPEGSKVFAIGAVLKLSSRAVNNMYNLLARCISNREKFIILYNVLDAKHIDRKHSTLLVCSGCLFELYREFIKYLISWEAMLSVLDALKQAISCNTVLQTDFKDKLNITVINKLINLLYELAYLYISVYEEVYKMLVNAEITPIAKNSWNIPPTKKYNIISHDILRKIRDPEILQSYVNGIDCILDEDPIFKAVISHNLPTTVFTMQVLLSKIIVQNNLQISKPNEEFVASCILENSRHRYAFTGGNIWYIKGTTDITKISKCKKIKNSTPERKLNKCKSKRTIKYAEVFYKKFYR